MANFIFGSGIVGLVAKEVLAGPWQIVPFRRSRFYSFSTPLADNCIIRDKDLDPLIEALGGRLAPMFYRRAYSIQGQLVGTHDPALCTLWLQKIFGTQVPAQAPAYWANRLTSPIYNVHINKLYEQLQNKHLATLKEEAAKGEVTAIGDHQFIRGGATVDFDNIISTIPLSKLLKLLNQPGSLEAPLPAQPLHYIHLESRTINLEGYNQALVVDDVLDFFKVTCLAPRRYLFYSTRDIPNPGAYLLPIIGVAEIIDGTAIADALPMGNMPDLSHLEERGIFCVGALAQHDWCADIGSNLLRLTRYAQRSYKPS